MDQAKPGPNAETRVFAIGGRRSEPEWRYPMSRVKVRVVSRLAAVVPICDVSAGEGRP
ncbi:MAG: hypothetical protein M3130_07965 [Actinomycetota bacterium]|nr:hypothetical protein [Actinomycetota bacterium]